MATLQIETTLKRTQPWWQLLSIQTANSICLPNILVGHLLSNKFGCFPALLAIVTGNIFLLLFGYFFALIGARFPESTAQHALQHFGNRGNFFISILMTAFMLCWFGIQLNVMGISLQSLHSIYGSHFPLLFYLIPAGIVLSFFMRLGMKTVKFLSYLTVPFLLMTVFYAILSSTGSIPLSIGPLSLSWLGGISLVIGSNIGGAIDLPTFFRHANSEKDAKICVFLLYGCTIPFIQAAGIYLSSISGEKSIFDLLRPDQGIFWEIGVYCFSIISSWSTNNGNLYSAFASSNLLPIKISDRSKVLILGGIGTCIGCYITLENFEPILNCMGSAIGSIGAIILPTYFFGVKRPNFYASFFSWFIGFIFSVVSLSLEFSITKITVLDAFLISFILQLATNLYLLKKQRHKQKCYVTHAAESS